LEKLERKRPLGILGADWRIILKCMEGTDWIDMAQDRNNGALL
jgi:hypothetical protein